MARSSALACRQVWSITVDRQLKPTFREVQMLVVQVRRTVPSDLNHQAFFCGPIHPTAWDASVGVGPVTVAVYAPARSGGSKVA
jgi:hypothetical protein